MRWLVLVFLLVAARPVAADTSGAPELDAVVAHGVKKLDETHYEVRATVIDAILDHPLALGKGARFVVAIKTRDPYGFKLYSIRPTSLYARIGFANGDTLETINGIALTNVAALTDAYPKLASAKVFELGLMRRGKPLMITITVK